MSGGEQFYTIKVPMSLINNFIKGVQLKFCLVFTIRKT